MNPSDLSALTVYQDFMTVLKEKGFSDAQASEILLKLIAQAEMEVTEAVVEKLSDDQIKTLDSLPEDSSAFDIAQKLGLDAQEIDALRAQKTAQLIQEMVPGLNQD